MALFGAIPGDKHLQEVIPHDSSSGTAWSFDSMPNANTEPRSLTSPGPQQTRKPTTFNPQALLNPNAGRHAETTADEPDTSTNDGGYGAGSMIENLNGVISREDAPSRKRNHQAIEIDDSDTERKKQKARSSSGGGGLLSEGIKEQQQKALQSGAGPSEELIDLTNDDNDEPVILGANTMDGDEEKCFGVLKCLANIYRIPVVPQRLRTALGKDFWPATKVALQRDNVQTAKVHLQDRSNNRIGTLSDPKTGQCIAQLIHGAGVSKVRLRSLLPPRPKKHGDVVGARVSQRIEVHITVSAPFNKAKSIGTFLSRSQLWLQKPIGNPGLDYYNPQDAHQNYAPTSSTKLPTTGTLKPQDRVVSVQRTVEEMRRETSSMFDNLVKAEDLPEMEADSTFISSELMPHQKQALHFMMEHERDDFEGDHESPPNSLWKYKIRNNGKPAWHHLITGEEVLEKPEHLQGGILADVMGLGKTLSILALIAETHEASKSFRLEDREQNGRSTLIVCPKSVLSNWKEQISTHTRNLKVYTYHGTSRLQDLRTLGKNDIVLTSYNTAASEFDAKGRKRGALISMNWFRIVLDEAHSIRNTATQTYKGCCALSAERRWAVTGTPVQNKLDDLGALIQFLRLKPFDRPFTWSQYINAPFKKCDVNVMINLQILVGSLTLRRMKGTVGLPDRQEHRVRLDFAREEKLLYNQFAAKSRIQFQTLSHGRDGVLKGKAYAHILKSIARLRAICAHGREMLTEEDMKEIEGHDLNNAIQLDLGDEPELEEGFVLEKEAYKTLAMMRDSDVATCESCGERLLDPKNTADDDGEEDYSDEDDSADADAEDEEAAETISKARDVMACMTPCFHLICPKCTNRHNEEVETLKDSDGRYDCQFCEAHIRYGLYPLQRTVLRRFEEDRISKLNPKAARWDETSYSGPHTKVKALLEDLKKSAEDSKNLPAGEPPYRSVVFSGWTSYLDLIEYALGNAGFGCTRIDGSMSVKQQSQALATFNTNDDVVVLLVSIKAGGQGLNFTAANKVYVMEPQFNPGVEQQAVDRVHRIGQTRDVVIKHFLMKDSVEYYIVELQNKKEDMAAMSMEKKRSKHEETRERMASLKTLFK